MTTMTQRHEDRTGVVRKSIEKLVLVTRKTRLDGLVARFNSRAQAKFYIGHAGGDFSEYEKEHDAYHRALADVRRALDLGIKTQVMDRSLLPTTFFTDRDLIVTLGQDGLVANAAKYVGSQPIVAVNPDPFRFDGILLPFQVADTRAAVRRFLDGRGATRRVTLAEARLNDGQRLLAFNDLFIGPRSHVSARYRIRFGDRAEAQSSSGIVVSTGAGSTGWLSSLFNMAAGIAAFTGTPAPKGMTLRWEDPDLVFIVREPFRSRHSAATLVAGRVSPETEFVVESAMPSGGVIFSDGMDRDILSFNSGAVATIRAADRRARLAIRK